MNKRLKKFCFLFLAAILLVGCTKGNNEIKDSGMNVEFPRTFEKVSEKVKFNCILEVPDNFTGADIHKIRVLGSCYGDSEGILSNYVEENEILERHEIPADEDMPEENIYKMTDESVISMGSQFSFGSKNSKYYFYIGATSSDNREEFSEDQISFASTEDAIEAVKREMNKIGFSNLEFNYGVYPISHESMKRLEEKYVSEGYMQEKQKKDIWTEEDDAYVVYAYQIKDGLPVFHELMSINHMMAFDNSDNTPVQAIYSVRGMESLMVGSVYNFEDTEEILILKEFDEIAKVVENKFENILNDAHYIVNRAKLFQMVRRDENQKYVAEPVWYFEVVENKSSKSVVLVNAVTGKEIFLT